MKSLQRVFVTGILVLVPFLATIDLLRWFIGGIDRVAREYLPDFILAIDFPGLGLLIALSMVLLAGVLAQNYVGRWLLDFSDHLLKRIGIVGGIYSAIKKFLETVFNPRSDKFAGVVMVQFPRAGIYSIGFRTGKPDPKLSAHGKNLTNVFVPCTPNPTSGFYLLVEESELVPLNMTVQEAFKVVISMGMVTSEDHHLVTP